MQRRRVEAVRALLAAEPASAWRLGELGAATHCSPFHPARHFRALTGVTIGEHLLRLRVGLALERLVGGEDDLARLALDLGFASHGHLSARFRHAVGRSPREVRRILTAPPPDRG